MSFDKYRVTLFKQKIRASIPGGSSIRFDSSRDGSHLHIKLFMRYYGKQNEVAALISKHLQRKRIDHKIVKDPFNLYWDWPENEKPAFSVSIPVDQEALPERKRNYGKAKM